MELSDLPSCLTIPPVATHLRNAGFRVATQVTLKGSVYAIALRTAFVEDRVAPIAGDRVLAPFRWYRSFFMRNFGGKERFHGHMNPYFAESLLL